MSVQTFIPLWTPEYKIEQGSQTAASSSTSTITLTFTENIIVLFCNVGSWINGTVDDATYGTNSIYYVNPNLEFFKKWNVQFQTKGVPAAPTCYGNESSYGTNATWVTDKSVQIRDGGGTSSKRIFQYIAILEPAKTDGNLYLLEKTKLYTDGTVTSSVANAVTSAGTKIYQISVNALVNITGATYIYISN